MDETDELIIKAALTVVLTLPLLIILLLPTWFMFNGNWNGYLTWVPLTITISGYWYKIGMIVYLLKGILSLKSNIVLGGIYYGFLGWFGMPLLKSSIVLLVTIPISGLELQRTILTIILIEIFSANAYTTLISSEFETKGDKDG